MADIILLGDADENGTINAADVVAIQWMVLGMIFPTPEAYARAYGVLDNGDAVWTDRIITGVA